MSTITNQNFDTNLKAFIAGGVTLRTQAQALISFGFTQYKDHGDTGKLSRVINACNAIKTIPSKAVKEYIQDHANIKLVKHAKTGQYVFRKVVKGEAPQVKEITMTWYEWKSNKANEAKPDFDLTSQLKSLVTRLTSAEDEEKNIKMDDVDDQLSMLQRHIDSLRKDAVKQALQA